MTKLIMWNLVTLDGYFEGEKPWDLSFHETVWGPELETLSKEFGKKADVLIFGRRTYEGMAAHWKAATTEPGEITSFMNALPKLVASRTLTEADWNNTTVTSDIASAIRARKAEADQSKNLYVFGSAELIDSLLAEGFVDEIMLCVAPVTIGKGTRLFKEGRAADMSLAEARPLQTGGVILRYTVNK